MTLQKSYDSPNSNYSTFVAIEILCTGTKNISKLFVVQILLLFLPFQKKFMHTSPDVLFDKMVSTLEKYVTSIFEDTNYTMYYNYTCRPSSWIYRALSNLLIKGQYDINKYSKQILLYLMNNKCWDSVMETIIEK